ncbi:ribbon-helix-helix domain-containing protein [Candidatus Palauibacter sp.]|uniref:ribbon-helix-helix domain-containing protein n=1 Tax=Candidatus Palauibacter sp. TaxID=3101350 RepID=UPI003B021888
MMRPISLKMPRHLAREVSEAARRRGVSRSALIREALETFLRRERAAPTVSALSRAVDLVGAFPGPDDLSVNPDYMRGFGR